MCWTNCFMCFFSLQTGAIFVSSYMLTLATIGLSCLPFLPNSGESPSIAFIAAFMILLFIAFLLALFGTLSESETIIIVSIVLGIISLVLWLSLTLPSFLSEAMPNCIGYRCGESHWLVPRQWDNRQLHPPYIYTTPRAFLADTKDLLRIPGRAMPSNNISYDDSTDHRGKTLDDVENNVIIDGKEDMVSGLEKVDVDSGNPSGTKFKGWDDGAQTESKKKEFKEDAQKDNIEGNGFGGARFEDNTPPNALKTTHQDQSGSKKPKNVERKNKPRIRTKAESEASGRRPKNKSGRRKQPTTRNSSDDFFGNVRVKNELNSTLSNKNDSLSIFGEESQQVLLPRSFKIVNHQKTILVSTKSHTPNPLIQTDQPVSIALMCLYGLSFAFALGTLVMYYRRLQKEHRGVTYCISGCTM